MDQGFPLLFTKSRTKLGCTPKKQWIFYFSIFLIFVAIHYSKWRFTFHFTRKQAFRKRFSASVENILSNLLTSK
jgi:hypothetical protein